MGMHGTMRTIARKRLRNRHNVIGTMCRLQYYFAVNKRGIKKKRNKQTNKKWSGSVRQLENLRLFRCSWAIILGETTSGPTPLIATHSTNPLGVIYEPRAFFRLIGHTGYATNDHRKYDWPRERVRLRLLVWKNKNTHTHTYSHTHTCTLRLIIIAT